MRYKNLIMNRITVDLICLFLNNFFEFFWSWWVMMVYNA